MTDPSSLPSPTPLTPLTPPKPPAPPSPDGLQDHVAYLGLGEPRSASQECLPPAAEARTSDWPIRSEPAPKGVGDQSKKKGRKGGGGLEFDYTTVTALSKGTDAVDSKMMMMMMMMMMYSIKLSVFDCCSALMPAVS
ncbi:hypothetical protein CDD80_6234 [Ophiocordyceps camponoti-rufipedis]|uniref:Uncharacterized protein n=1 Tax=Ophiocordyceps camponoti-rufipedis TaxID=2004952 RepID=A0A2C5YL27_9HYPO|nr:hypothetical protein CDD80_6234 [Ophiocordyceps camponoti-rufipedis]